MDPQPDKVYKTSFFQKVSSELEIDTRMLAMIGALIIIWIVLTFLTDGIFLTARNLYNLAVQTSVVGIMATGMVLVIVARHIDLSVGSLMGFTGMVIAYLQVHVFSLGAAWNWPLTVLCGLALGGLVGLWQGWWVAFRGGAGVCRDPWRSPCFSWWGISGNGRQNGSSDGQNVPASWRRNQWFNRGHVELGIWYSVHPADDFRSN